jgi:hypothetical protein
MFDDVGDAVRFALTYKNLVEDLVRRFDHKTFGWSKPPPRIVAVCGRSRSGKSVIAHAFMRTLRETGVDCLLVRLDDWIQPAAERQPGDTAEIRNRVDRLPAIIAALRGGETITAPGYDSATRVEGTTVTYQPAGKSVIVLDGVFAAHDSIRSQIDFAAFVDTPEAIQRRRFEALYRWKGFDDAAMEELWRARIADEWAGVDAQREHCDEIVSTDISGP